jgi:hypothetical protein
MNTLSQIFRSALYPLRFIADWLQRFLLSSRGFVFAFLTLALAPFGWLADFVIWLQSLLLVQILGATALLSTMWDNINSAFAILMPPLAFINVFVPITQLLVAFSLLLALWVFGLLYRFVKSLIPTLS